MPENYKSLITQETSASDSGVLIDIDGVVLKGGKPFEYSKDSLHKLWNNNIPFAFLTNGTYTSDTIKNIMTSIFDLPFEKEHFIVAPSPCLALTNYHGKHVLVCCQDDAIDLITELGFKSFITVPELSDIFPELDYVDHNRRLELNKMARTEELKQLQTNFKPIEAILMLGEPTNWECQLQLLIDVLMLNGDPRSKLQSLPKVHLPIIACNKDVTFKASAQLPRFGHGAFLECLEALYKKITNNDLHYEILMGKPCLITYEFAAMQIRNLAKRKNGKEVKKFVFIGDNPDVDIRGANNFKEYLSKQSQSTGTEEISALETSEESEKCSHVEALLVSTGVYNPQNDIQVQVSKLLETSLTTSRADLEATKKLTKKLLGDNSYINYFQNKQNVPDKIVNNLSDAVEHILKTNI